MKKIAILAVQGAFIEHEMRLLKMGYEVTELRQASDLQQSFDGLVLPGGESTTQSKLLHQLGMFDGLQSRIQEGLPTLGTCAGLILLAETVEGCGDMRGRDSAFAALREDVSGFKTLPVTVSRNAYGRQLGSFHAEAPFLPGGDFTCCEGDDPDAIPLTFIRAPKIESVGEGVTVLVEYDGVPVAVDYGNQVGVAFHPELDADDTLYNFWLNKLN